MKRITSLFVFFLLLGMAQGVWAQPPRDYLQAVRQYIQAEREGNVEALAALYAEDAILVRASWPFRFEGRQAITRHLAEFFKEFPTRRPTAYHVSTKFYGDSTAVSAFYVVNDAVDRNGKPRTFHLRITGTRVKQGGKWLIVSYHVSRLPNSP